jgi:hypothetical protein
MAGFKFRKDETPTDRQAALLSEFVNIAECAIEADEKRKKSWFDFSKSDYVILYQICAKLEKAGDRASHS